MRMIRKSLLPVLILLNSACSPSPPEAEDPQMAVPVTTVHVSRAPADHFLPALGSVDFAPDHQQSYAIAYEGQVTDVFIAPGQSVQKGQALLQIHATPNALLDRDKAASDVKFASEALTHIQTLRSAQLATNADIIAAEQTLANARNSYDAALQKIGPRPETVVRAQHDGVVQTVSASQGQLVTPGLALVQIADAEAKRVVVAVEPENIGRLHGGQPVRLYGLHAGMPPCLGHIADVLVQIDPQTKLAQATVAVPARCQLLPGSTVRAEIVIEHVDNTLFIPRTAILRDGSSEYVFVAAGNKATRQNIITRSDGGDKDSVELVSGLQMADEIIVDGVTQLKVGDKISRLKPAR